MCTQQWHSWFRGVQFQPDRHKRSVQRPVQTPSHRRFGMDTIQPAASAQPRALSKTRSESDTRLV